MSHQSHILLLLAALLYSHAGYAFDNSTFIAPGAEAQLVLERIDRDIISQGVTGELRSQRLQANLYEAPYRWLQGGFHFGYLTASHDDAILTSGLSPVGESLGITLRSPRMYQRTIAPHWSLSYTYNKADRSDEVYRSDIRWHDYFAKLGLILRAGELSLSGGGYYAELEGEEQSYETISATVTTSTTRRFKARNNGGSWLSINYTLNHNRYLEFTLMSGAQHGAALTFATQF